MTFLEDNLEKKFVFFFFDGQYMLVIKLPNVQMAQDKMCCWKCLSLSPATQFPFLGDNHFRYVVAKLLSMKISISLSICGLLVPGHHSLPFLTPKKQTFTNPQVLYMKVWYYHTA